MRIAEQVVYFALQPPPEAAEAAGGVLREAAARLRLRRPVVSAQRLHVSLYGLGAFEASPPAPVIRAARRVGAQVAARPFRLAFNRVGTWGRGAGKRPIVLWGDEGVIGAEALHDSLHGALVASGLRRGPPPDLRPHMTLARDGIERPQELVAPVSWWVDEFVLLNSHFGAGRHEVLDRFPLDGREPLRAS